MTKMTKMTEMTTPEKKFKKTKKSCRKIRKPQNRRRTFAASFERQRTKIDPFFRISNSDVSLT
jgi:hypothetical protein